MSHVSDCMHSCLTAWSRLTIVWLGVQVPRECPQAVSDLVGVCLSTYPCDRPTANDIMCVIETSIADNETAAAAAVAQPAAPAE